MLQNIYSALETKELYPFHILQRYESNKFSLKKTLHKPALQMHVKVKLCDSQIVLQNAEPL